MKANAPEKIQVHLVKNDYDDWSIEGYSFLSDKQLGMTEYTRTDALIDKVSEWLKDCATFTDMNGKKRIDEELYKTSFDDFKNYTKGE